jgi:hypothetical protein
MTGSGAKLADIGSTDPLVRDVNRLFVVDETSLIAFDFEHCSQTFDRLIELGMKDDDENKILALKFFVKQTPQYKLK